jgi:hypothetical protein
MFQGFNDLETFETFETFETLKLALSDDPSPERRSSIEEFSTRAFFKR